MNVVLIVLVTLALVVGGIVLLLVLMNQTGPKPMSGRPPYRS